jgi:hypothetical protein
VTFTSVWYYVCTYLKNVGPGRTALRFIGCDLEGSFIKT